MDNKDTETDTSDSFFENENWQIFSAADASSNGGERVLRVRVKKHKKQKFQRIVYILLILPCDKITAR